MELESERAGREDLAGSAKELEKKNKMLEADLVRAQHDLLASERARKDVQAEKDEIFDEMHTATRLIFLSVTYSSFILYIVDVWLALTFALQNCSK